MTIIDLRKATKASSGQKITQMYPKTNSNVEKRIDNVENKLDKILNLLENKKENN